MRRVVGLFVCLLVYVSKSPVLGVADVLCFHMLWAFGTFLRFCPSTRFLRASVPKNDDCLSRCGPFPPSVPSFSVRRHFSLDKNPKPHEATNARSKGNKIDAYRLYLVTDDQQDLDTLKRVVKKAVEGGVTMVQLREKHGDVRAFIERAQAVKKILKDTNVPLIINDRVDVALAVDADGVHLGQSDMPADIARKLIGPNKILGLSIENEDQLAGADSLPIDYIGLSAIFPTPTKANTKKHWGVDGLKMSLNTTSLPIVAIGGINETNIPELITTGVHGLALVSAICHANDPKAASEYLLGLMD